jgi:hypothetical protein
VPAHADPAPPQPHGNFDNFSIVPSYTELRPSQPQARLNQASFVPSYTESVRWPDTDASAFPGGYSPIIGPHVAPVPSLIRQPDPPPVAAPVHTLESLDYSYSQVPQEHSHAQIPPSLVADPRPGSPHSSEDEYGQQKGPKHLHIVSTPDAYIQLVLSATEKCLVWNYVCAIPFVASVGSVFKQGVKSQQSCRFCHCLTLGSCRAVNQNDGRVSGTL